MKKGEGYIDICAGILAFALFLSVSLNIFSCLSLRSEMEAAAETVLEAATRAGCLENEEILGLLARYADEKGLRVSLTCETAANHVQLGERIYVEVERETALKAAGIRLPFTLRCRRSGLSEKYWKAVP